jgi:hypothetical protein
MLPEFTHFIFTRIDTHFITNNIRFTTKHIYFIKINTVAGPKCDPNSNSELLVEILWMNGL